MIGLDEIKKAAEVLKGHVLDTPCVYSQTLSTLVGADLFLKFENLQYTSSFKERGALNKLESLTPEERHRGAVALSAGNHAQGVAYHASRLGIAATIVMPVNTPPVKVARTQAFGAEVVLHGTSLAEAGELLKKLQAERNLILVHPYDDDLVIAGQGTAGLEILAAVPDLDCIVVPIGGGGLISGIAVAAKALRPDIRIIGVQTEKFPSMAKFLGTWQGEISGGVSVAEGIAVATTGPVTSEYVKAYVDDIVVVSERDIEDAIALLLQIEKTLCEGAGAAGLAALTAYPEKFRGLKVATLLSGGNIDTRLLISVLQASLVRQGRLIRLRVVTPDVSGALGKLCSAIGELGGNINTVSHDRSFSGSGAKNTTIDFEIEVRDPDDATRIVNHINTLGYSASIGA